MIFQLTGLYALLMLSACSPDKQEASPVFEGRVLFEEGVLNMDSLEQQEPTLWVRSFEERKATLLLSGPSGNWRLRGGKGLEYINPKSGTLPVTLRVRRNGFANPIFLEIEFIGPEFIDRKGNKHSKGAGLHYRYQWNWPQTKSND